MTVVDAPERVLPRPYLAWLSGTTVARLGEAVLGFALGWAASGHGGTTAALVLTLNGLPRLVLLVVGGAVADRFGARRLLVAGEAGLLALTVVLAVALARFGTPAWLLLAASLVLGTVTAFCLPAWGSMPRRLVEDDQLSRALAVRQVVNQTVLMVAAPLGGVLVGSAGLPAIAWGHAVTICVSLGVLVVVRELSGPASDRVPDGLAEKTPAARARAPRLDLLDGFRVAARAPGLRAALLLTGAGAALILPVPSLLVPLLGRASGWGPGPTGIVAGAVGVGVIGAALLAARRTAPTSAGGGAPRAAGAGLAVSAAGVCLLAACSRVDGPGAGVAAVVLGVVVAVVGALTFGFGNGMFVTRMAPFVLGSAPRTHLARVQALVGLVQLVPVMVTNNVLGVLAEHTAPGWALAATAAGLAASAAWARRPAARKPRARDRA